MKGLKGKRGGRGKEERPQLTEVDAVKCTIEVSSVAPLETSTQPKVTQLDVTLEKMVSA